MTMSPSLPEGNAPKALRLEHFPTRQQAFVWRNWEMVPVATLAAVLGATEEQVLDLAEGMGLRVPPRVNPHWLARGYVTLLRNNWHLLPYEQLLQLLGWSAQKMDFHLREDDFLFIKLGELKPKCQPVVYAPLTKEKQQRTEKLRELLRMHFAPIDKGPEVPAFGFLDQYGASVVPTKPPAEDGRFDLRLIYPYFSMYGDPLMDDENDPLPEALLARLAEMGMNGVWMQAVLYTLVPFSLAPEMSAGWEKRIQKLRVLAQRAKKFGLGLYLYLNEPRALPLSVFEKHPQYKGVEESYRDLAAMCPSVPETLEMLRNNVETLYRSVPELAGAFTITMSENLTHCGSHYHGNECPRCSRRPLEEIVAEINTAIEQGIHAANPKARVLVWTWGWLQEWDHKAVDLLPANVELMCSSERFLHTNVGGIPGEVQDYSISQVGPAENAKSLWRHALDRGMKAVAKVQINTTWECSAMPYIPAVDLVEEHLNRLADCGVTGLMASWTLGGFPGGNLELLTSSAKELAALNYGSVAPLVREAWSRFSEAFREFPFDVWVIYLGPHNLGPANLLYSTPTNYQATMVGIPYDDLSRWRHMYPDEIFEQQFQKLSEMWAEGLVSLARAKEKCEDIASENLLNLTRVAEATYCHFRSTYLQIAFIRLRDGQAEDKTPRMHAILDEEIELAKRIYTVARQDSTIGFEASNQYAYSRNDLREKVLNCECIRQTITGKSW